MEAGSCVFEASLTIGQIAALRRLFPAVGTVQELVYQAVDKAVEAGGDALLDGES